MPNACLSNDRTITILVKPVIIRSTAGRNESAVKNSSVWIGTEKLRPESPFPTSKGNWALFCASNTQGVSINTTANANRFIAAFIAGVRRLEVESSIALKPLPWIFRRPKPIHSVTATQLVSRVGSLQSAPSHLEPAMSDCQLAPLRP